MLEEIQYHDHQANLRRIQLGLPLPVIHPTIPQGGPTEVPASILPLATDSTLLPPDLSRQPVTTLEETQQSSDRSRDQPGLE